MTLQSRAFATGWSTLDAFWRDERGASAAEYALILAVVGPGIGAAALALGSNLKESGSTMETDLNATNAYVDVGSTPSAWPGGSPPAGGSDGSDPAGTDNGQNDNGGGSDGSGGSDKGNNGKSDEAPGHNRS